jgi:DNA polymerase-1
MPKVKKERPYIFVDGLNVFLRHYLVNETVNTKSEPIGGVVGFIRFIDQMTTHFMPSKIFVVWEAGGPSKRRMHIYPGYKANRAKSKMDSVMKPNASVKDMLKVDEQTKVNQLTLLSKLLKFTPVCQIFVKGVECDDIIAHLVSSHYRGNGSDKIIASNDKDFYQLLEDPSVKIWNPALKMIITGKDVFEKYNIAPRNFCLARALVGDVSDNIDGVPSVGLKTAQKRFTKLADGTVDLTVGDLLQECKVQMENKGKLLIWERVKQSEALIRRNWKLMYLSSGVLQPKQIRKIEYTIETHKAGMNKMGLIKEVLNEGIITPFDFDRFASNLKCSVVFQDPEETQGEETADNL